MLSLYPGNFILFISLFKKEADENHRRKGQSLAVSQLFHPAYSDESSRTRKLPNLFPEVPKSENVVNIGQQLLEVVPLCDGLATNAETSRNTQTLGEILLSSFICSPTDLFTHPDVFTEQY